MFNDKKDRNIDNSIKDDNKPCFDDILNDNKQDFDSINNENTSIEEDEDNLYTQLSFDTMLESDSEKNDCDDDNSSISNPIHDIDLSKFVSTEDLENTIKKISIEKNKSIRKSIITSTLISSLITASAIGGYNIIYKNSFTPNTTKIVVDGENKTSNVFKAVATKATPSVVGITTLSLTPGNFFSLPTQTEGVGSGVIVDKNGYILTNSHVVDDGNATKVSVLFNDGTTSDGKVLWNDSTLDLAVIKVDKSNLDVADLGDSDKIEVGDISIAIGNPIGLELNKSVTQGIISGKDRTLPTGSGTTMTGLLQTDASINPGNSGGPLLNEKGEVIGINTAKISDSEGLGFAIPINTAKPIIEQIIKNGDFQKVSLGINGIDVANFSSYQGVQLSTEDGVYVIEVTKNTPAQKAGLKAGDIITKVDNNKISSMSDLYKVLYQYRKGDNAKLTIVREGIEKTIDINFSIQKSTINTDNKTETQENIYNNHSESSFDQFLN